MHLSSTQIYTTVVVIVAALVLIMLERRFPYDKGQVLFRKQFFNDFVMYSLVQSYVLGLVISIFVQWVGQTHFAIFAFIGAMPVWGQLIFFTVEHDLYIYTFHRLQHNSKYLWRVHEAHHATSEVDWLSGARSHSLEILINQTFEFGVMYLLGASPDAIVIKGAIDAVWGMYIHSNINVHEGKLQYFINGPEMHRWHHATDADSHNRNFATKLAIWDWIFGTAFLPKDRKPSGYGLGDVDFPSNYFKQHVFAFRKFER